MIIARSSSDAVRSRTLARPPGGCELYRDLQNTHDLAILDAEADAGLDAWQATRATVLFDGGHHGPEAGEWLFCVGLWVPDQARSEFLAWYRDEHLPILLECASWDGCRFVEVAAPSGCQFYALHQLAERAALGSAERARSRATPWFHRLKAHAWFDEPFTRVLYRRVAIR